MTPEMFRKLSMIGLSHDQMASVLEIFEEEASARKAKVKARVDKWRAKNKQETLRNVTERSETSPNVTERLVRVEDNNLTKDSSGKKETTSPAARSNRGARIPDDFRPDIEAAVSEGLSRQEAERQARSFCDYWRAKPGAAALKLDWQATWRTWFRRRLDERPASRPPDRPPRNAGEAARLELLRRETLDAPNSQIRHHDESDGGPGFAGTGIARRIALASSR
jgi:hypothetical protein